MIRVCEMITELAPAGAERVVYELATRLDRSRFGVSVAALRGGAVAERLRDAGVEVFVLGVAGKWDVLKVRELSRWLAAGRFDMVHTHLFHADLAGRLAARLAGVPRVAHTVHVAERRFLPWRSLYGRLFQRRGPVVCVSESVRADHIRRSGISPRRCVTIENGIDLAAYARNASRGLAWRERLGVGEADRLAVWAGRLCDQKGLDILLQALPLAAQRLGPRDAGILPACLADVSSASGGEDACSSSNGQAYGSHNAGETPASRARLVVAIAGQGPWQGMVEEFVRNQPADGAVRVVFPGFVDEIAGLYSAGDFLVMPSRWEGFGLSAVEAMAASLPVIATDVEGLRDVMLPGQTGLLIPPENPAALAEAMIRLAHDTPLRRHMATVARRRAETFAVDTMVAAHEKLYLEMMGQD
ncbi:MAG: glycosyltransferase [Phycisphaerae bacterium]|nr:glycosyltransferase [Phycisphaerae bacterium]